ncbi:unnamed protein product, partial [Prorocentrum cordatum]
ASVAAQQMSDVKSAAYQIQRLGYKVGSIIKPRKAGQNSSACALWIIKEIGEAIATKAPTGVHANGEPLALALGNLKDLRVPATAKPQEVLTFSNMLPSPNTSWRIEHVKSQICLCLTAASEESETKFAGLKIYTNPFALQALQDFDPNALAMSPAVDLGALMSKPPTAPHLMPQFVTGKQSGQNFVSTFFCVPTDKSPNMSRVKASCDIQLTMHPGDTPEHFAIQLPVLKNTAKVKAGTFLSQGCAQKRTRVGPDVNEQSPAKRGR